METIFKTMEMIPLYLCVESDKHYKCSNMVALGFHKRKSPNWYKLYSDYLPYENNNGKQLDGRQCSKCFLDIILFGFYNEEH